jgi:cytidylate kinase
MIITIDGPSGTGKSSVAKALAQKLQISFFDTGALYRSLAWWASQEAIAYEDVVDELSHFDFRILEEGESKRYFVGQTEVTQEIRTPEISEKASKIAALGPIRQALLPLQRDYAAKKDSVFEGRDLGSVVFPQAQIKIFLTAKPEIRAHRRFLELQARNPATDVGQILQAQEKRDEQDTNRKVAPLVCPEGAFLLDTSDLTKEQVVETLYQHVLSWKKSCKDG